MSYRVSRIAIGSLETHLFGLSGLIAIASVGFIWFAPESHTHTVPEVIVPLGISLVLGVYTFWLKRRNPRTELDRSVKYGWAGAIVSGTIGGIWLTLHVYQGVPIDVLPDKILTVLSVGVATGVLVGHVSSSARHASSRPPD